MRSAERRPTRAAPSIRRRSADGAHVGQNAAGLVDRSGLGGGGYRRCRRGRACRSRSPCGGLCRHPRDLRLGGPDGAAAPVSAGLESFARRRGNGLALHAHSAHRYSSLDAVQLAWRARFCSVRRPSTRLILGSNLEYHRRLDGPMPGEENSAVSRRTNFEYRQQHRRCEAPPLSGLGAARRNGGLRDFDLRSLRAASDRDEARRLNSALRPRVIVERSSRNRGLDPAAAA